MSGSRPRVLIVEDDRSWQQILSEILSDDGLEVDLATSYSDAVVAIRRQAHRVAVVDLSLREEDHSNRDGLKVLNAIRSLDPGCVTVLLTGYATVELAVSALTEHGALTCLQKTAFRRSGFRELVRKALATAPGDTRPVEVAVGGPATDSPMDRRARASRGRALLVEDDAGWRAILSELLIEDGYGVRTCSAYTDALGVLMHSRFDLAVVDLSLTEPAHAEPNEDGYRLLSTTRSAGIPTIVVTGTARADNIARAYLDYGVFACLEKRSFDRPAFRRTLAELRASGGAGGELDTLSERERQVLDLLARGLPNKEIASRLVISENTVKRHLKAVFEKLDVHTRAAAVAKALNAAIPAEGTGIRDLH